jgi:chromosome segregation ATPase
MTGTIPNNTKRISTREDLPMMKVLRQRETVDHMRHDNEVLRLDLTRESRESRKANSTGAASDITRLQDQAAMYVKKIESEREKIASIDKEIADYQARILEQKTRMGGVNAAQTNNQLMKKQISVLQSRVDQTLLKYNETLANNKVLRGRIEEYRKERIVFDGIYKKLERELHEKKKEMAAVIEDSKNAYKAREKSQSEMLALQQHADKERVEFESEFKELGEHIKKQQLMLEQLRLKQFDRTQDEPNTLAIEDTNDDGDMAGNMTGWALNNKDKAAPLSQEKIYKYESALLKIQESTGIEDVNEIVTRFLESEEQNFSLFNYVNDINTEIERLEHSIAEMRNQIEKYRGQGMSTDTQRKKALRDLEDRLSRTERKADEYDTRFQRAVRTISQLKTGIHSIYTRIGAASTSVEEMLGNQGVTESNMMQYLGIIEQRTSEILQAYAASQQAQANEHTLQLPTVHTDGATKFNVAPPSYDDMSNLADGDDSEEDERPLTRQELDKRTLRDLNKALNPAAP